MTKLAATDMPVAPDNTVKLDVTTRTPALLVSADHLEVNFSKICLNLCTLMVMVVILPSDSGGYFT